MDILGNNSVREGSEGYRSSDSHGDDGEYDGNRIAKDKEIYVNRSLNLSKIRCYGFDMDYTLCEYISPQFDELACNLAKKFMVDTLGYSADILDIEYNPDFPVRGVWFDKPTGNLLKVNQFGKIMECYHGFRMLKSDEIKAIYPNKIQRKDDSRIFVMNTIFNLAETFLICALIDHFDKKEEYAECNDGWVKTGNHFMFATLFMDLRAAVDDMHIGSCLLKKQCLANLPKYVKKDKDLPVMLDKIKRSGRKSFLLTNSDWWHTRQIMAFLLGSSADDKEAWLSYFDLVVVDACKPQFFTSGTPLQYVDTSSSVLLPISSCPPGQTVYSGGNHATITSMLEAKGPDVIYAGDHLYGDVIKCRKHCDWRTLLIVPELKHEEKAIQKCSSLTEEINHLETALAKNPDSQELKIKLNEAVTKISQRFSETGSLLRSGNEMTYFASQLLIWADLYTDRVTALASYNLEHMFTSRPTKLMRKGPR